MKFIKSIIDIEKKYFKYFFKSSFDMREMLTGKLFDYKIKKNKILKKKTKDLMFYFFHNSKITRDFLLNPKLKPKYVWEPQTTKLILQISKKAKNIIFAGAFFGDQAIITAKKNFNANIHAFEPHKDQFKCLKLNKKKNKLSNIFVNRNVLSSKSKKSFKLVYPDMFSKNLDDGCLAMKETHELKKSSIQSITIDDYCSKNKIKKIDLLHMDVEGSELKILLGSKNKIKNNLISNIIFELNSNYFNWDKGLKNISIIKYLIKNKYSVYAIRDIHSSYDANDIEIELLSLKNIYTDGPNHGFNMLATKNSGIKAKFIKRKCSPKYLPYKSNKYFHTKKLKNLYNK